MLKRRDTQILISKHKSIFAYKHINIDVDSVFVNRDKWLIMKLPALHCIGKMGTLLTLVSLFLSKIGIVVSVVE